MSKSPSTKSSAPRFTLGDIVRKKVNKEVAGMITGLITRPEAVTQFLVTWGDAADEQVHYEIELIADSDCVESAN